MRVWIAIAIWGVAGAAVPAQGQVDPDSVHHRNECRLAEQVLSKGHPANRTEWAARRAVTCGEMGGQAIADALRRLAESGAGAERLEPVVTAASDISDAHIFSTALALVRNPSLATAERVQAIRAVYFQLRPGSVAPYEAFLDRTSPHYLRDPHHRPRIGTPLPPGAREEAAQVACELLARTDTPAAVRTALLYLARGC